MQREHPPCVSQLWLVLCQFRGLALVYHSLTLGVTQVSRSCLHLVFSDALQHAWLWTAVQQRTLENSSLHLTHSPPSTPSNSREHNQKHSNIQLQTHTPTLSAETGGLPLDSSPYFPQHVNKPLGRSKAFKGTSWGSCNRPSYERFWTRNTELEIPSCPSKHATPFFTGLAAFVTWVHPTVLLQSPATAYTALQGSEVPSHPCCWQPCHLLKRWWHTHAS